MGVIEGQENFQEIKSNLKKQQRQMLRRTIFFE